HTASSRIVGLRRALGWEKIRRRPSCSPAATRSGRGSSLRFRNVSQGSLSPADCSHVNWYIEPAADFQVRQRRLVVSQGDPCCGIEERWQYTWSNEICQESLRRSLPLPRRGQSEWARI